MPAVEIDETELANYRQVAGAMQQMLANPQTRRKVLEAQKILRPDAVIPELDAAKPVLDEIDRLSKRFDSFAEDSKKDREARDEKERLGSLKSRWSQGQAAAKAQGYDSDGMKALEAFMEEHGIADHDIAIPAFERKHPQPQPVATTSPRLYPSIGDMKADDSMKLLLDDPDQYLAKIIPETLRDMRGR